MSVSFILPALNEEAYIGGCLESIRAVARPQDEIIVVDNGSTDRTREIVRGFDGVRLLVHPGLSIAALRNRGAASAGGELLAFVDADCVVDPGWREALERRMADPRVSATGSISGIPDDATWVERAWWAFGTPEPRPVHYIASANLVVRRTAFDAIGGFDETLVTDEDADIGTRLSGAGHRMIDDPAVRVVHLDNAKTLAQFAAKERWHATSIVRGTSLRDLDKPMWMTWMFIGCALLFLASWFLAVRSPWWPAAGFSLLLVPPALTAAFRGLQYRKWRFFFSWIVLYFVFYAVRSVRVLHVLFRSNAG